MSYGGIRQCSCQPAANCCAFELCSLLFFKPDLCQQFCLLVKLKQSSVQHGLAMSHSFGSCYPDTLQRWLAVCFLSGYICIYCVEMQVWQQIFIFNDSFRSIALRRGCEGSCEGGNPKAQISFSAAQHMSRFST